jgi:hypothetical protein
LKFLRRLLMGLAIILVLPNLFAFGERFKSDIPKEIREQVKSGSVKQFKLNQEVSLEQDTIEFKQLLLTETETWLVFEVNTKEPGWSFPNVSLQLNDGLGKTYQYEGGYSSGRPWGEFIVNHYERLPDEMDSVTVNFKWYDRAFQTELPLEREEHK